MKYLERLNGTAKTLVSLAVLIGVALTFNSYFAKASEVEELQQGVGKIVSVLTINYITRKTVLELKKANGGLNASETVELKSLYEILKTLEK